MSRFDITHTPLHGLLVVARRQQTDPRGYFSRFFCAEEFARRGFTLPIAQINHTCTRHRGAVRGLHFQRQPHAEDKFVSCLKGEVWDVAVDLRRNSPTYLRWHAERLSAENQRSLLIPQGFAHGFQTLSDDCELLYLHTRAYQPGAEGGLRPNDPSLGIDWPLPIGEMSERDANHPLLDADFVGV